MSGAKVVQFDRPREMTDEEFEQAYAEFERDHKLGPRHDQAEREARRAMALAKLLYDCGKPQRWLAERLDKTQPWVEYQLRYGRFLNIYLITDVIKYHPLTEGGFRKLWKQTEREGDRAHRPLLAERERERFAAVLELIEAMPPKSEAVKRSKEEKVHDQKLGAAIVQRFRDDGSWHRPETLTRSLNIDIEELPHALKTIRKADTEVQTRGGGGKEEYRFINVKTVSAQMLIEKLGPMINSLITGLKMAAEHPVHDNPRVALAQAQAIKVMFDRLTQ